MRVTVPILDPIPEEERRILDAFRNQEPIEIDGRPALIVAATYVRKGRRRVQLQYSPRFLPEEQG